jgi:DHA3 family macrolide efflux protein-like MFS transporter
MTDPPKRNWKIPFFTIWTGQAFSLLGSRLVGFALIWWLTEETASATMLAAATSMYTIPAILFGPISGTMVDRWPRKWTLIISDSLIAVVTAVMGLLFWFDIAEPWHILAILFIRAAGDSFQNPTMQATTAAMVSHDWLPRVGGMNFTLMGILSFVAPGLGAALLAFSEMQVILALDIITAVVAIAPLFFVPIPQPEPEEGTVPNSVWQDIKEGARYMWNHKGIRALVGASVLIGVAIAPVFSFAPLLITEHFGGDAAQLALYQSVGGIASIAGGLLMSTWGGFKRRMRTSVIGTFAGAIFRLLIGFAPANAFWLALVGNAGVGAARAFSGSSINAVYQSVVQEKIQGRFFAWQRSLVMLATPLSLAIAGPVADRVGVRPFWFVGGALSLVVALIRRFSKDAYYIEDTIPDVEAKAEAEAEPAAATASD